MVAVDEVHEHRVRLEPEGEADGFFAVVRRPDDVDPLVEVEREAERLGE